MTSGLVELVTFLAWTGLPESRANGFATTATAEAARRTGTENLMMQILTADLIEEDETEEVPKPKQTAAMTE